MAQQLRTVTLPLTATQHLLVSIRANGREICLPLGFINIISDTPKFATKFKPASKKAVPDLKSDNGTLWTACIIHNKKRELEKALQGMAKYVPLRVIGCWLFVLRPLA